ncbi:hypothetical protein VDG1235_4182 [Verrucomicrobiia bacterium DG1235]|nr:hypothetical protein VDG1235_4182 [Verrucomicrobiae bacterium DG1235]
MLKKKAVGLCFAVLLSLVCLEHRVSAQAESPGSSGSDSSSRGGRTIDLRNLARTIYEENLRIAASRYDLVAAEIDFERFEKDLAQFTPIVLKGELERNSERSGTGVSLSRVSEDAYVTKIGSEKEFFNGSNVFVGTGYKETIGDTSGESHAFAEFDAKFPLFGSATKLQLVTSRTFEENELFNKRLDLIETIRDRISSAYMEYLALQIHLSRSGMIESAVADLGRLLENSKDSGDSVARVQIEDELKSLNARLSGEHERVASALIDLKDDIGLRSLTLEEVAPLDLLSDSFYGKWYLNRDTRELFEETYRNDIEIRVLKKAVENEELKKRLALKGKWDVFGRVFGESEFRGSGDRRNQSEYFVGVGFDVKKLDPRLLKLSIKRADARLMKFRSEIEHRQQGLLNDIEKTHGKISSLYDQSKEIKESVASRKGVFERKEIAFSRGDSTIDSLVDSRIRMLDTQLDLIAAMSDLFEEIIDLDETTGSYFEDLGLSDGDSLKGG